MELYCSDVLNSSGISGFFKLCPRGNDDIDIAVNIQNQEP